MVESLLEFVCNGPDDEVFHLPLEDFAVASAWYRSLERGDERTEKYAGLPKRVDAWIHEYAPPATLTEGRRQQPLIRAALNTAQEGGVSALHPVEMDILLEAWPIIEACREREFTARLAEFFETTVKPSVLETKRGGLPATPALRWLERRMSYVTENQLLRAHAQAVSTFGGVDLPKRGPLAVFRTYVRVLNSVPDDTALVVEEHGCCVNGYVMGRIAATGSCEVRENVAGVIIVRKGEIRARNVINNAYVVVKTGNVCLKTAENPKLIFAGDTIHIHEKAIGGRITAQEIAIAGDVTGGEYNVSKSLTARHFRQTTTRELAIVLRRYISAEDYGELIGEEASRLIARLAKTRQRRNHIRDLIAMAEQESDHYAASAIMYLFGGDSIRKKIEELNRSQRRLAFLERVIASIDALSVTTEEQLMAHTREAKAATVLLEEFDDLDDVENELNEMAAEGEMDGDLRAEREALRSLGRELAKERETKKVAPSALFNLRERKVAWMLERDDLHSGVRNLESAIRQSLGKGELIEKTDWKQPKGHILAQLLAVAKKRPPGDPLAERASSPFVRLMLRTIESRIHRSKNYRQTLDQLSETFARENEKLDEHFRLASPLQEQRTELADVRVTGRFDRGVTLALERYLLQTQDPGQGMVLDTADSRGETVTYRRQANTIRLVTGDDDTPNEDDAQEDIIDV